ncbi:hypothetical protein DFQ04_3093 [Algoriphagus boseongensis]|uniref:Uncharacterized protein n=1 Tax=Algoriphagus boseongensis TaxID=1442587 RepID=A0A4R6T673_9BACT|nr:hypothetical protein [Algoriphagus boseongensis]TDQ15207.1 hypothetical protein DFQ04_3093 [Algoriphagus boseongensis]
MLNEEKNLEEAYPAPEGKFYYLDNTKIVKNYPTLNKSYLMIHKDGQEYHLLAFDFETNQFLVKDEVKEILRTFFPLYRVLMEESLKEDAMDFEKIALGIAIGMKTYYQFEQAIIYFRQLYTYGFLKKSNFKGKYPIGKPNEPKDKFNLGYIFQTYPIKGKEMYTYDGYVFPEDVLRILLENYDIIEFDHQPRVFKGVLSDVWKFKRKP